MTTSAPRTARARARIEVTNEIKQAARRHLALDGATSLSLRAVAREVGMVSSAVYRYFPSRDDLLTALIVDAYASVGEQAVAAESAVRRSDLIGRWLAAARAVRAWSIANPHEHGLIFGTPIPGYVAPRDTVDPAAIVPRLLLAILTDADERGSTVSWAERPIPKTVRTDLRALRDEVGISLSDAALGQGLLAWTQLIGVISFELFGHMHNVIVDFDTYFDHQMRNIGVDLGLVS